MPVKPISDHWNENDVAAAIERAFPSPAFVTLRQVRNGTGIGRRVTRTADAISASVWPSRGLYLTGFEIKVSRQDWKREIIHPEKADEMHGYCRYWYVAAPKGVVELAEVPETWGYLEVGRSKSTVVKQSPATEVKPPDLLLLCSILRAAAAATVPLGEVQQRIKDKVDEHIKHAASLKDSERELAIAKVKAFEEASGLPMQWEWDAKKVGTALRTVLTYKGGPEEVVDAMRKLAARCREEIERLEKVFAFSISKTPAETNIDDG